MSPKTPEQFRERREEKKSLIMAVALELFANEGYFKTTTYNIARHAGISKGLMYNYFASKKELLAAIINSSLEEISGRFNPAKDGHLSDEEFELFVGKLFSILREKIDFSRLFSQLMLQKDVRDQFLKSGHGRLNSDQIMYSNRSNAFLILISKMIKEYFIRKKNRKPYDYDPDLDMNLFICTLEGFARITLFQDEIDENLYQKTINKIIELYK